MIEVVRGELLFAMMLTHWVRTPNSGLYFNNWLDDIGVKDIDINSFDVVHSFRVSEEMHTALMVKYG